MSSRMSTSSRASGALPSPRGGQDSGRWCSVKSNHSVRKSSRPGSGLLPTLATRDYKGTNSDKHLSRGGLDHKNQLPNYIKTLSSSPTSETSMVPDFEEQPYLPGVSHANLSVVPGSDGARKMTVTSGRKCSGLYRKQDPLGSLARMLLESSTWNSNKCVLTWKVKVMKSNRLLFQLAPSTLRIEGIGSGLLRTPGTEAEGRGEYKTPERIQERWDKGHQVLLTQQIAMLPTPKSQNSTGAGEHGQGGKDLQTTVGTLPGSKLRLEPAFVEYMMGYPEGWTDLRLSETPSSHRSYTKSLRKSQG